MSRIDIYELNDECSCAVAPDWGCNLFSWKVNGEELIYTPDDYPEAATKITGGGNPILFPSVGRTWDQSSGEPVAGNYRIAGIDKAFFMPSHGILFLSHFDKIDESRDSQSVSSTYKLTIPDSVREQNYPFDLGLIQKYTLEADRVEIETVITNNGDVPAPCAFGYHPYFRISNPQREGVEVRLNMRKHLLLTKKTVLLTGKFEDTNGEIALQPDIYYDSAYAEPSANQMSIIDQKAGRTIFLDFDDKCELFFLYSPDGSDFVCIEPWTRGLGAYESLKEPGWQDGKLIPILQPDETIKYRATFGVEFH